MQNIFKPKIIVILGPTASGKSDLAVKLAKKFNGEIISADSRQVYKGLNIGTGKITNKEMLGIKHYLLDVVEPKTRFSVSDYKTLAEKAIQKILKKNKLPIICGGSGFYIDTLLNKVELPKVPENKSLRKKLEKKSAPQLLVMLMKIDPIRGRIIASNNSEKNNPRRIIRVIEIAMLSRQLLVNGSEPMTKLNQNPINILAQHYYEPFYICLQLTKTELHTRIHDRLISRIDSGMINETKRLHKNGLSWKRMNELGLEYRYFAKYLQNKLTKDELIEQLNIAIRQYAKRQMTWFKRNKKIKCFKPDEYKRIVNAINLYIKN